MSHSISTKSGSLRSLRLAGAVSTFLLGACVLAEAAPAGGNEAKAVQIVGQARSLAVSIERDQLSRDAQKKKWDELRDLVDSQNISEFVLADKWAAATPPQRRGFANALSDLVVQRLSERLGNPMAEPFEIGMARTLDGGDVVVVSHVKFRDGHTGELDWRLRSSGAKMAVADVLVDGVSVAVAARDEVATELKSNGGSIAQLVASMRNRLRFK